MAGDTAQGQGSSLASSWLQLATSSRNDTHHLIEMISRHIMQQTLFGSSSRECRGVFSPISSTPIGPMAAACSWMSFETKSDVLVICQRDDLRKYMRAVCWIVKCCKMQGSRELKTHGTGCTFLMATAAPGTTGKGRRVQLAGCSWREKKIQVCARRFFGSIVIGRGGVLRFSLALDVKSPSAFLSHRSSPLLEAHETLAAACMASVTLQSCQCVRPPHIARNLSNSRYFGRAAYLLSQMIAGDIP